MVEKEKKIFDVDEYTIGDKKTSRERIVFASVEAKREAEEAFKNSEDIEVRITDDDGKPIIITVPYKLITSRLYTGEISIAARDKTGEKSQ